jgi:hypothetical protein
MSAFHDGAVLLDRRAAAEFLTSKGYRIAVATLAKLACIGGGPLFKHWGRKPIYRTTDLLEWVEAKTSGPKRSTSEVT